MFKDYYKILGLNPEADDTEIKQAYRKLSKKFHPDLNEGDSYFSDMFRDVQEAYEVLSNPQRKAAYLLIYGNFYNVRTSSQHSSQKQSNTQSNTSAPPPPPPKSEPRVKESPSPSKSNGSTYVSDSAKRKIFLVIVLVIIFMAIGNHIIKKGREIRESQEQISNNNSTNENIVVPVETKPEDGTKAVISYIYSGNTLFKPSDFYNNADYYDYYNSFKSDVDDPTIYEGEVVKYDFDGGKHTPGENDESLSAIEIKTTKLIRMSESSAKLGFDPQLNNNETYWVVYKRSLSPQIGLQREKEFKEHVVEGAKIRFSTVWNGGNAVGNLVLNHVEFLGPKTESFDKVQAGELVNLSGIVKYELFYGRPNYGQSPQTDEKEYSYILHLDNPIYLHDEEYNNPYWTKVDAVHIINDERIASYAGRKVKSRMKISRAFTGHHHADAISSSIENISGQ